MKLVVVREVSDQKLIHEPVKRFIKRATLKVLGTVQNRAPIDYGNLVNSLNLGAGVSVIKDDHGIVGTKVDYGRILNESQTKRYRATAHRGKKLNSWFDKGVDDAWPSLHDKLIPDLAADIEDAWRA